MRLSRVVPLVVLLALGALLLRVELPAQPACDYYVTPDGNNGNAGTSEGAAWATWNFANSQVTAGETVCIGGAPSYGSFTASATLSTSGSSGNVITWRSISGQTPTIDGAGADAYGIILSGDYLVLDGLVSQSGMTVTGWDFAGIQITGDNVAVRNLRVTDNGENNPPGYGHGIEVYPTNDTSEDNNIEVGWVRADSNGFTGMSAWRANDMWVHDSIFETSDAIPADSDGFQTHDTDDVLYERNITRNNAEDGADFGRENPIDRGSFNTRVLDSTTFGHANAGFSNSGNLDGITYVGNLAYDNNLDYNFYANSDNARLVHNTSYANDAAFQTFGDSVNTHINYGLINNNLVAVAGTTAAFLSWITSGLYIEDNNLWNNGGAFSARSEVGGGPGCNLLGNTTCDTWSNTEVDDGTFCSERSLACSGFARDPDFTNTAANDYTLLATSDLIDAGRFLMLTNGSGSGTVVTVQANGGESDPRLYFISAGGVGNDATGSWFGGTASAIEIVGCGERTVQSMSATTITIDTTCSWADNAGVSFAWEGSAPDIGAFEFVAAADATPQIRLRLADEE